VLLHGEETRVREAGEPEGQAGGLYAGTDHEMPRERQGTSLRTQEDPVASSRCSWEIGIVECWKGGMLGYRAVR